MINIMGNEALDWRRLCGCLVLCLILSGCGDDDSDQSGSSSSSASSSSTSSNSTSSASSTSSSTSSGGGPSTVPGVHWATDTVPSSAHLIQDFYPAYSMTAADFDGDGDDDVLITTHSDSEYTIELFLSDGRDVPSFEHRKMPVEIYNVSVQGVYDLEGDGDLDLLIHRRIYGSPRTYDIVGILVNDGSGYFQYQEIVKKVYSTSDRALSDVDGDGDLDLLVKRSDYFYENEHEVVWYENNGQSQFEEQSIILASEESFIFSSGDLNGDGLDDLLISTSEGVDWYKNEGGEGPTYAVQRIIDTEYTARTWVADINNDGHIDFFSRVGNSFYQYLNDGMPTPSFTSVEIIGLANPKGQLIDMDGDGDLDISSATLPLANRVDYQTVWFENNGADVPVFHKHVLVNNVKGVGTFVPADLNGDGIKEMVSTETVQYGGKDEINWYFLNGQQVLAQEKVTTRYVEPAGTDSGNISYTLSGIDKAFFDISSTSGEITFNAPAFANPQDNNRDNRYHIQVNASSAGGAVRRSITFVVYVDDQDDDNDGVPDARDDFPLDRYRHTDTDNDGMDDSVDTDDDNDLVADLFDNAPRDDESSSTPLWSEDPDSYISDVRFQEELYRTGVMKLADLDNDGDTDIVVAGELTWFENRGSGSGYVTHLIEGLRLANDVAIGDIDGDGDLDIVTDKGAWYENNGTQPAAFTERLIVEGASWVNVALGDIDDDGDLDLLTGRQGLLGGINLFLNNGGTFDSGLEVFHTGPEGILNVVDVDNDGHFDITGNNITFSWFKNHGDGKAFSPILDIPSQDHFVFGDTNGDGNTELVVLEDSVLNRYRYINYSWVLMGTVGDLLGDKYSIIGLNLKDVDDDGDLDVLATSRNHGPTGDEALPLFVWFENDGGPSPHYTRHIITNELGRIVTPLPSSLQIVDADFDGIKDILFTSNDGVMRYVPVAHERIMVEEQSNWSKQLQASDADGNQLEYRIRTGADAHLFSMSKSGVLSFNGVPPVNQPTDSNQDNVYEVWVSVSDGYTTQNRLLALEAYVNDGDRDDDGIPDAEDAFPGDPREYLDTDADGLGNFADSDDDGDGVEDHLDNAPLDSLSTKAPEWPVAELPHSDVSKDILLQKQGIAYADINKDGVPDYIGKGMDRTLVYYPDKPLPDGQYMARTISQLPADYGLNVVRVIDLDSDGLQDVIIGLVRSGSSAADDELRWYRNKGGPSPVFDEYILADDLGKIEKIFFADLDGDGDKDIVVNDSKSRVNVWYENNLTTLPDFPKRYFQDPVKTAATIPVLADVNQDGAMDLIDGRYWYQNDGAGNFVEWIIQDSSEEYISGAGDMDGDGDLDLVARSYWLSNDGGAQMSYIKMPFRNAGAAWETYDIDFDGDLDLVYFGRTFSLLWLENDGGDNPAFLFHEVDVPPLSAERHIDRSDGYVLEIVKSSAQSLKFHSAVQLVFAQDGTSESWSVAANDVDNNPIDYSIQLGVDKAFFSVDANGVVSFQGADANAPSDANRDGIYEAYLSAYDGRSLVHQPIKVKVYKDDEDDDNDGVLDTLDADPLNPYIGMDTDGDGVDNAVDTDDDDDGVEDGFDPAPQDANVYSIPEWPQPLTISVNTISEATDSARTAFAQDLDGDGDTDVITTSQSGFSDSNSVILYQNQDNQFTQRTIFQVNKGFGPTSAADLNNDGDLDIVMRLAQFGDTYWLDNTNPSVPQYASRQLGHDLTGPAIAADIDDDGDLDLLTLGLGAGQLAWLANNGANIPQFNERLISGNAIGVDIHEAADLDGDGDLDLIAEYKDTIFYYENLGQGQFSDEHRYPVSYVGLNGLRTVDFDQDGDIDIVGSAGSKVYWYENMGDDFPVFKEHVAARNYTGTFNLRDVMDMDGDGDLDLVNSVAYKTDVDSVVWLETVSLEPLVFAPNIQTPPLFGSPLDVADIDADGLPDILGVQVYASSTLWWQSASVLDVSVANGNRFVSLQQATDEDGGSLSYAISHGPDADLFSIDSAGSVSFKSTPNVLAPADANRDNVYQLSISVTDGIFTRMRALKVRVE